MRTLRPYLGLLFLALIAFWPLVLHPTHTLYSNSSDLLAQHLPAKYFLVRSLRETGELPLWNPEQYSGSPFVHDIQVGLFYPLHLPLYFISEPAIGPFVSWLLFLHVLLAGSFMYAYARHAGMSELAAFVAGVGFMLSPRWMMQLFLAGHVVTQGICWLPLVLLCVERAIQRKRWSWAVGGGVAYAMLILGAHPQWTFYASLLIGLWPLRLIQASLPDLASLPRKRGESSLAPPAYEGGSLRHFLIRWLTVEAIVVLIGVSLCAVQLLPTCEAAGQSSRASGMGQSWSIDGAKAAATSLIGPFPERIAEPIHWETRGGIGYTWAVLAMSAYWIVGKSVRLPVLIAGGMLAYVLGASVLIDRLPGFSSFRMPTRMLLTLAFPVAFLCGQAIDALRSSWPEKCLGRASAIAFLLSIPVLLSVIKIEMIELSASWLVYWLLVPATWIVLLKLALRLSMQNRMIAVVTVLVADVLLVSLPYSKTRNASEVFPPSRLIQYIRERNPEGQRVYDPPHNYEEGYDTSKDVLALQLGSILGPGSPGASIYGVPSIRGYNPLDVARYRQYLAFIADVNEPQTAFSGSFTHPVIPLIQIKNRKLWELLSVRYVVANSSSKDSTIDKTWHYRIGDMGLTNYNFLVGFQYLLSLEVFENPAVMPRAFIVADAVPQAPQADVLAQLKIYELF